MSSKILIVDDDPALQEQLAWALKRDFGLVQCLERKGALKAAASEVPDLVLLDLRLPKIDGIDVLFVGPSGTGKSHFLRLLAGRSAHAARVMAGLKPCATGTAIGRS